MERRRCASGGEEAGEGREVEAGREVVEGCGGGEGGMREVGMEGG